MATIVLVDGIGWGQPSARLVDEWLRGLGDGLRRRGHDDLVDALLAGAAVVNDDRLQVRARPDLSAGQVEFAEQLALAWLRTAAERAPTRHDQTLAFIALRRLRAGGQTRSASEKLAGLAWFGGPGGVSWPMLRQFGAYLLDSALRSDAQQEVLKLIGDDTRLVIAHSLGCVVAFEALRHCRQPVQFVTLGSPLSTPCVAAQLPVTTVPACVESWTDVVDIDDLVASTAGLREVFPPAEGRLVVPDTVRVKNGHARPDRPGGYLSCAAVADAVAHAL